MRFDNSDRNKPIVRRRNAEIVALIKAGELSMREIGKLHNISYQRVGQIWKRATAPPVVDFTKQ